MEPCCYSHLNGGLPLTPSQGGGTGGKALVFFYVLWTDTFVFVFHSPLGGTEGALFSPPWGELVEALIL